MDGIALPPIGVFLARMAGPHPALRPVEDEATSFEDVYQAHYRDVFRHVILSTRGRDDVEEIVAETFARAFASWRDGRGPAGRALPWLLVIARRITTDRWRRTRLIAWVPLPESARPHPQGWVGRHTGAFEPGGVDPAAGVAEFWLWLDALSKVLPARQRDVIILRYQKDLSDTEIGEILGLSASGVRTLASRALDGLRRHPELWA